MRATSLAPAVVSRARPYQESNGDLSHSKAKLTWNKSMSIESLLVHIKLMLGKPEFKKNPQPPDGTTYS